MKRIICLLRDIFFFFQILVYWPLALILLKPLWWIDKISGAGYFRYLDKFIKKIAGT
jgi:hypothetical protein